jgi:branched-chain amino acid aminotransferase
MFSINDLEVIRSERSKINDQELVNVPFGKYFTDHMLEMEYKDGAWQKPVIKPYGPISVEPSLAALHYGQAIFEGIKAYKFDNGQVAIFRGIENFKRFNISAARMQMPQVPEDIFMEGMAALVNIDSDWIPLVEDHALYIRPLLFATDCFLGVKASETYKFFIMLSPCGPYFAAPLKVLVEEHYVRAVKGGVGYAKTAGNYGSAMQAFVEAKAKGFDQVLWTDPFEHKYIHEMGVMNVFFIIGNKAFTPSLEDGTILAGVTRDSVMVLLTEMGIEVVEGNVSIDKIVEAYTAGTLREVFGTGTAATISMIKEIHYQGVQMQFDTDTWTVSPALKEGLEDIKQGKVADRFGWMYPV